MCAGSGRFEILLLLLVVVFIVCVDFVIEWQFDVLGQGQLEHVEIF